MDQSVISLNVSQDSEFLATGSTDGKIAIWKLQSGICTRRFSPAHSQGVTSICFNKEANHILSGSYDHSVKIHHVKSGKLVRALEGHTSFVNSVLYNWDNTLVLSASSDGEIKVRIQVNLKHSKTHPILDLGCYIWILSFYYHTSL